MTERCRSFAASAPVLSAPVPARQSCLRIGAKCHCIVICAWMLAAPLANGQAASLNESRGEMLYQNHCIACHTTQVHWRDQRLAKDWPSLRAQVRRWERNTGLTWNDEDIEIVSHYLNQRYYRFPDPPKDKAISMFIRRHRASEGQGDGGLSETFSSGN